MTYKCTYDSPVGILRIEADENAIISVSQQKDNRQDPPSHPILAECCRQMNEYFDGKRKSFELPLDPRGTEFQKKVWNELIGIPYGKTVTYADIARQTGNPKACRAVGMANNRNPIMIIIPCHRVIGADGSLTGYAAGTDKKQLLLELERTAL